MKYRPSHQGGLGQMPCANNQTRTTAKSFLYENLQCLSSAVEKTLRKSALVVTAGMVTLLTQSTAQAITIGGAEYDKILTVSSRQDFGLWTAADKYYTFRRNDNYIKPVNINRVTHRDPILNGISFEEVIAMGTTSDDHSHIETGVVEVFGKKDEVLLSLNYISNGIVDATYKKGRSGQLDVFGVYEITGGSLFNSGLLTGSLYLEIAFDHVWQNKFADLKVRNGTFTFYQQTGDLPPPPPPPTSEVPTPGSLGLLLSTIALATAKCAIRKK